MAEQHACDQDCAHTVSLDGDPAQVRMDDLRAGDGWEAVRPWPDRSNSAIPHEAVDAYDQGYHTSALADVYPRGLRGWDREQVQIRAGLDRAYPILVALAIRPVRELAEHWYRAAGLSAAADELAEVLDRVTRDLPPRTTDQPVTAAPASGSYTEADVQALAEVLTRAYAAGSVPGAYPIARAVLDAGWRRTATPAEGPDR